MLMQPEYRTDPWLTYFTALKKLYTENGGLSLGAATDYFQREDGAQVGAPREVFRSWRRHDRY
jgi:hypothetical protein